METFAEVLFISGVSLEKKTAVISKIYLELCSDIITNSNVSYKVLSRTGSVFISHKEFYGKHQRKI